MELIIIIVAITAIIVIYSMMNMKIKETRFFLISFYICIFFIVKGLQLTISYCFSDNILVT